MSTFTPEEKVTGLVSALVPYLDAAEAYEWADKDLAEYISRVRESCVVAADAARYGQAKLELQAWADIAAVAHRRAVLVQEYLDGSTSKLA